MKDFISKVTFGFIMAQLFPGMILVLSITFGTICFSDSPGTTISSHLDYSIEFWISNTKLQIGFLAISLGTGMAIHGLHWGILGFLESRYPSIVDTFWHDWPIIVQILIGPVKLFIEVVLFLFLGKNIRDIAIDENIPEMNKDNIDLYHSLEDFYLHFSQFYAHTAFALFISTIAIFTYVFSVGFTQYRLTILILSYLLTGFFFFIGRIQLIGLFKAEKEILKNQNTYLPFHHKLLNRQ